MSSIQDIELSNFRNFKNIRLEFSQGLNVFIGENGQGKTNLIESLHLLTKGKTFRPDKNNNLIRNNTPDNAFIKASIYKHQTKNDVHILLTSNQKQIHFNKKRWNKGRLTKHFFNVLFSPESLMVLKGSPEGRREMIDDLVALKSPSHNQLIQDFKKTLKTRNKILKDHKKQLLSETEFQYQFEAINEIFLKHSTTLVSERISVIKETQDSFQESVQYLLGSSCESAHLDYCVSDKSITHQSQEQIYVALCRKIDELKVAEKAIGSSMVGPQKHDIQFIYNNQNAKYFCSQGEQRSLVLAFKLAQILYYHALYNDYPIILLDDVFSELDYTRCQNLIEFLRKIKTQIFLTTTNASPLEFFEKKENLKLFEISDGKINFL